MISQTAHFPGLTPRRLYDAFLSADDHAAMTADGRQRVSYQRPDGSPAGVPQAGDLLLAFGQPAGGGAVLLQRSGQHNGVAFMDRRNAGDGGLGG